MKSAEYWWWETWSVYYYYTDITLINNLSWWLFISAGVASSTSVSTEHQSNQSIDICNVLKQAEKLKSREMKEGWMKNVKDEWGKMNEECEGWMMNDEGWRMKDDDFKLLRGFENKQMDKQTFVNVVSLSQQKSLKSWKRGELKLNMNADKCWLMIKVNW